MNERPEIPASWLELALGEVIDYGRTVKAEPSEIPADAWVLELEDIEKDTSQLLQRLTFAERQSKSTKNRFATGDVLYGKLRPYLNKVLIANQDGYCTTEIVPLKPNLAINERYLFYWLKHPEFLSYVESVSHGIQMPRLGTEAGLKAPLILAPVNEQRRIVAKLDRLFARSRSAREELERIPKLCDRYKQVVLAAAYSGRLTAAWRENQASHNMNPEIINTERDEKGWLNLKAGDVCSVQCGSTPKGKPFTEKGDVPYLKVYNIVDQKISFDYRPQFIPYEVHQKELKRCITLPGDVLMNIVGPPLGKVAIVTNQFDEWNINQALVLFRPKEIIMKEYLYYFLREGQFVRKVEHETKGSVGQINISLTQCRNCVIPIPSLKEQKEIVQQIEKLFKALDLMAQEYQKASKLLDRLDQATLAKAFRGELVPQDPNDEPAAALLERILAERQNQTPAKRGSTKKAR